MSNLAIITARGGSKRIPRKNIREFCGVPIIAYSIAAALDSKVFDEVMVSTDDYEIADIAKRYGAKVPFMRTEQTSNDYATTYDVVREVLEQYRLAHRIFEYACCLYPTAPFVTGEKLRVAYEMLIEKKVDTLLPIVKYGFPPQRAFVIENSRIKYQNQQYVNSRSQDLEPIYHDSGQFYYFKIDSFEKQKKLIMDDCYGMLVSEEEVQDIDTISDWKIAELKYQLMIKEESYDSLGKNKEKYEMEVNKE